MRFALCSNKADKPLFVYFRVLLLTACYLFPAVCISSDKVFVGVASSMRLAWPQWLAAAKDSFSGEDTVEFATSFSSSGNLARQIRQGAPLDLFVSASLEYVDILRRPRSHVVKSTTFAGGDLAIVVLKKGRFAEASDEKQLDELLSVEPEAFASLSSLRISLANARHAPYGIAAGEVLENLDLDSRHQKLFAENASQAVQFLTSGGADIAIVPVSLLITRPAEFLWRRIDSHLYKPVVHHLVLLEGASPDAAELYESLLRPEVLQSLLSHGFRTIPVVDPDVDSTSVPAIKKSK